ncbi:spore coat U domain-containing protein [Herbaspirillum lusitanum]|uniref:Spore coat U domain-containing protein n=1 Tax=Herbaspirillum lusitanum TaxID=213312 RepID=A0ABW9A8S3_9BURK
MIKKKIQSFIIAMMVTAIASAPVAAASITGTLGVITQVFSACAVTGSTVAFGVYGSSQLDQTGSITVLCTFGTSYNVGLDSGTGSGATTAVRKMTGLAGSTLNYALYRDASRTSLWGSSIGTDTQSGFALGLPQNLTVYGRIPASQTARADTYSDTVTVTLTY